MIIADGDSPTSGNIDAFPLPKRLPRDAVALDIPVKSKDKEQPVEGKNCLKKRYTITRLMRTYK